MKTPKKGEIISKTLYLRVKGKPNSESIQTTDIGDGREIYVHGEELIQKFISASQFDITQEMSRTEICRVLINAGDKPFTVGFVKADGAFRHLTGHLLAHEDMMGRSMVFDFDVTSGDPMRQVDHRSLAYLILDGVCYRVKGLKLSPTEEPHA